MDWSNGDGLTGSFQAARVLVDEAVEPLPTHDHAAICDRLGLGRAEAQGAMWPGPVVMVEVLAQDLDQVALAQDDQPVQTLSSQGAQYPLAGGVGAGSAERGSGNPDASAEKTSSKPELYFESRSRINTVIGILSSSSSQATLRACCATQAESGFAVALQKTTWREPISRKTSTYKTPSRTLSTVRKSQARTAGA
jgi:hypothetical protein